MQSHKMNRPIDVFEFNTNWRCFSEDGTETL